MPRTRLHSNNAAKQQTYRDSKKITVECLDAIAPRFITGERGDRSIEIRFLIPPTQTEELPDGTYRHTWDLNSIGF